MSEKISTKHIFNAVVFALTAGLWIYTEFQESFPSIAGDILAAFLVVETIIVSFERYHASKRAYRIVVIPACYVLIYPFIAHNTVTFVAFIACTVWAIAMVAYARYKNLTA